MEQPNPKIARKWKHKESGRIVKAVPWMEIPDPVLELEAEDALAMAALKMDKPRKVKFGTLVQIGWMIENENNIYIGFGLEVEEQFDEVTDG